MWNIAYASSFLRLRPIQLPFLGRLDGIQSFFRSVHSAYDRAQRPQDGVRLPIGRTIISRQGSWGRPEFIDGKDGDEMR